MQPGQLETNLVTFCSNVLKVYTLGESSIDLRLSTSFNDKILDVIRVPTKPFVDKKQTEEAVIKKTEPKKQQTSARESRSKRRNKGEEKMIDTTGQDEVEEEKDQSKFEVENEGVDEEPPDYLFLITNNFNCTLLCFSKSSQDIEVISRGNISERVIHDRKEPPFPIFLGQNGTFITLMLYHNLIKVIPLVKSQHKH